MIEPGAIKNTYNFIKNADKACVACTGPLTSKAAKQTSICDKCHAKAKAAIKKFFKGKFKEGWREFKEVYWGKSE